MSDHNNKFDFPDIDYHCGWARFSEHFAKRTKLCQVTIFVDWLRRMKKFCDYFHGKLYKLFFLRIVSQMTKLRKVAQLVTDFKEIIIV